MKYNLGYLFDLLVVITNKDLKVRYKSSMLGYLWSVANPLLFAMIYYFIFKLVMRVQIPNYTVFLITACFRGNGLPVRPLTHYFHSSLTLNYQEDSFSPVRDSAK